MTPPEPQADPDPGATAGSRPATRDPWERFGWVMGAIWLIFLGFPISESLTTEAAVVWKVLAVLAILTYAAVYVAAFIRLNRSETWAQAAKIGAVHMVFMALLIAGVSLIIGFDAFGMLPFVVALAMFSMPLTVGLAIGLVVLTLAFVPWIYGDVSETFIFAPIVLMVGVLTAVIRMLQERQAVHLEHQGELALVAERERVARDVHDVLGHSLTVVSVKAQLAERMLGVDDDRARRELAEIQSLTRQSLAEIRATVAGLRVARLADELADATTALRGAGFTVEVSGEPDDVDPRHRIVLAWVLREATTNVLRHSQGSVCTIRFHSSGMSVTDDGVGLKDSNRRFQPGNGLRGLRERVASAGGTLNIGAAPSASGTEVEVTL